MIDRKHKLSVVRQAKLLGFSRGSVYYLPRPVPDGDLAMMRRIDELHLDYPFAGSRMLQGLLRGEGLETGRLHVATLMKKMSIEAMLSSHEHIQTSARSQNLFLPFRASLLGFCVAFARRSQLGIGTDRGTRRARRR